MSIYYQYILLTAKEPCNTQLIIW